MSFLSFVGSFSALVAYFLVSSGFFSAGFATATGLLSSILIY